MSQEQTSALVSSLYVLAGHCKLLLCQSLNITQKLTTLCPSFYLCLTIEQEDRPIGLVDFLKLSLMCPLMSPVAEWIWWWASLVLKATDKCLGSRGFESHGLHE